MKDRNKSSSEKADEKQLWEKFDALPLDEKLANLFKMEVVTISEAVSYVVNEPMKVAEKLGNMIVDLGNRIEKEFRGDSTNNQSSSQTPPSDEAKKKTRSRRRPEPGSPSA